MVPKTKKSSTKLHFHIHEEAMLPNTTVAAQTSFSTIKTYHNSLFPLQKAYTNHVRTEDLIYKYLSSAWIAIRKNV